ncbi:MAG: phosphopantothenoylcysteine decarboxylase, partial [Chitinophagaceae bacterium]
LNKIAQHGCNVLPVDHGELASGLVGEGRMAEPDAINNYLDIFFEYKDQFKGKKTLVTAGPTYEAIDPVRFIGNHSSGKMGYAIAEELASRGAEVILISGPVSIKPANKNIRLIKTISAKQMLTACRENKDFDIAVMAAAVADYTPAEVHSQKIKKDHGELVLQLKKTEDILSVFGNEKTSK